MFAPSYFAPSYFPGGFFPSVGGGPVPVDPNVYPSLPFIVGTRRKRSDGGVADYTEDGRPHKRRRFEVIWYDLEIVHQGLTQAQFDTIEAFYELHENDWVRINWPAGGRSYQAMLLDFQEPPQQEGLAFNVTVLARGRLI